MASRTSCIHQGMRGGGRLGEDIATVLAPGIGQGLKRLLRLTEVKRIDPTGMTTHTFSFDRVEKAYGIIDRKFPGLVKALVIFR